MRATRALIATLESRRDLLRRKQAQFALVAAQSGTIFGEDLPRVVGQYFQKGAEICRIADTRQLVVRLQVPEREIGDVRTLQLVRLKARAFPDVVFHGIVSKIGGESELDEYRQATYRVELIIENREGLLRPGMTAFARIDFDRRMIGRVLLHKSNRHCGLNCGCSEKAPELFPDRNWLVVFTTAEKCGLVIPDELRSEVSFLKC